MNRIQSLVKQARHRKRLADKFYRLAIQRRDEIREERRAYFRHGARENPMFHDLLHDPRGFEAMVVAMLKDDPTFLGHVDDWRTNETLAGSAAAQARMELALLGADLNDTN